MIENQLYTQGNHSNREALCRRGCSKENIGRVELCPSYPFQKQLLYCRLKDARRLTEPTIG